MTVALSLLDVVQGYGEQLQGHEPGLQYYRDFGLEERTIKEFQLGWMVEPLLPEHEHLIDLPTVPYLAVGDAVLGLRYDPFHFDDLGRPMGGWLNSEYPLGDTDLHLFNVRHALPGLRTNEVVVTSDVLSVLLLRQQGHRAVAVPGYANFHWPWLELFTASRVTMVANEEESEPATELQQRFARRQVPVQMMMLPGYDRLHTRLREGVELSDIVRHYGGI